MFPSRCPALSSHRQPPRAAVPTLPRYAPERWPGWQLGAGGQPAGVLTARISGNPAAAMILAGVSDQFKQRLRAIGRSSQFTLADTTGQALRQIMPPE